MVSIVDECSPQPKDALSMIGSGEAPSYLQLNLFLLTSSLSTLLYNPLQK